ncbi:hypothetical protein Vadar_020893 [Vaccinium darrowii]|uniref:Uncharacterized protein n=1 Tax=Vaccinium darrowii TaxID=229202 RepID=A0ACB7Z598_9ERIC|nr:hypothetical protein Vadar_020893 [Vaccinium darrowii]
MDIFATLMMLQLSSGDDSTHLSIGRGGSRGGRRSRWTFCDSDDAPATAPLISAATEVVEGVVVKGMEVVVVVMDAVGRFVLPKQTKTMKKKKNAMATATIDDLPEDLLLHIISFLPTLEAIRTCLISHKWRNLWHSLSSFDFDFNLFPPSDSFPETRDLFADYVNQTLARRSPHSPLHYFGLRFYFTEEHHDNVVPSWINYAINHGAVELDLDFHGYTDFSELDSDCCFYFLLEPLIQSQVTFLKLRSCDFRFPNPKTTVPIVSLRSMVLANVLLMDSWVCGLISLCVNLESLVIEDCVGPEDLKICSSKLKELSIWNFEDDPERVNSVEIRAPNLCSLGIVSLQMKNFSLEFSSSLIEANVAYSCRRTQFKYWSRVMRSLTGVKRLTTHNWWFEVLCIYIADDLHFLVLNDSSKKFNLRVSIRYGKDLCSETCDHYVMLMPLPAPIKLKVSKLVKFSLLQTKDLSEGFAFNNLVYLELETAYTKNDLIGLAAFLELSPKIETLVVDHDDYIEDDGSIPEDLLSSRITFSVPNIKLVGMKGFRGMDNEIFFWLLLKRSGVVLEDFRHPSGDT